MPVPLPFLTVKETTYRFILGIKKHENVVIQGSRIAGDGISLLNAVSKRLAEALTMHGIGAKTAAGYGYMTPLL